MRLVVLTILAALVLVAPFADAQAHDARPLALIITERTKDIYEARLTAPPSVAYDNQPVFDWPANCAPVAMPGGPELRASTSRHLAQCAGGLRGRKLSIHYPIYNPSLATLFRLDLRDGQVLTRLQPPESQSWVVPQTPAPLAVVGGYVRLGLTHIWTGIDHLLFIAGLLVLAGGIRRVLLAVTGFTLAHSITLVLSTLGLVRLPEAPVEAAIALSILFVAREIVWPSPDSIAARNPVLVATTFGLLHGFGFASALRDIGLPTGELALALFSFNIGVELGQLGFILSILALVWAIHRLRRESQRLRFTLLGRPRLYAGYLLGVPAAFWFFQRLQPMFV